MSNPCVATDYEPLQSASRSEVRALNKRLIIAVVAVVLGLVGSGCSSSSDIADGSDSAPASEMDNTTPSELAFAERGRRSVEALNFAGDASVEEKLSWFLAAAEDAVSGSGAEGAVIGDAEHHVIAALEACESLDRGNNIEEVVASTIALDEAYAASAELTGAVLGAGIETLCPWHSRWLESEN